MKTHFPVLLVLTALALTRPAPAAPTAVLYDGKDAATAGLSAASWGAGSGQESTEVFLFGGHSVKVTTLDGYQGARINFATPVPLSTGEAGRVFQITLRRGAATLHYDPRTVPGAMTATGQEQTAPGEGQPGGSPGGYPGGSPGGYPGGSPGGYPGGSPGGYPGGSPGGYPGGSSPGGYPGGNYPGSSSSDGMGSPGGNYPGGGGRRGGGRRRGGFGTRGGGPNGGGAAEAVPVIPLVNNLRLVFTLADGRQADVLRAIPATSDPALGEGWFSVNVPLSILKLPAGGDATLKALTIGGDHYGVFYVGRIQMATDTAPLTASIDGPATAAADVAVPLSAKVDGGFSNLRYTWDFGTGTGTTTGPAVSPRFPEGGQDYTVTLTVTDTDGIKQPVTATKKITTTEDAPQGQPGYPGGSPGGYPGGSPGGNYPGGGGMTQPGNGNDPRDQRSE